MILEKIKNVYDVKIYYRGEEYYKNGRVYEVLKIGDKLYGKVKGRGNIYDVKVDLNTFGVKMLISL